MLMMWARVTFYISEISCGRETIREKPDWTRLKELVSTWQPGNLATWQPGNLEACCLIHLWHRSWQGIIVPKKFNSSTIDEWQFSLKASDQHVLQNLNSQLSNWNQLSFVISPSYWWEHSEMSKRPINIYWQLKRTKFCTITLNWKYLSLEEFETIDKRQMSPSW